jgi:ABC-type branched-subunit amino acid transport system ATPase component
MLELRDIHVSFGGHHVLHGLNLKVNQSDRLGIYGANGSGKSTLINMATGFIKPNRGAFSLYSQSLMHQQPWAFARLGISRTFQTSRMQKTMNLGDQLGLTQEDRLYGQAMIAKTELMNYFDHFADEVPLAILRQFEIVRAIVRRPKILFLDEPSAGLSDRELDDLAKQMNQWLDPKCALVVVEHRRRFMDYVAKQIQHLSDGMLSKPLKPIL